MYKLLRGRALCVAKMYQTENSAGVRNVLIPLTKPKLAFRKSVRSWLVLTHYKDHTITGPVLITRAVPETFMDNMFMIDDERYY